jgi:hypothetical protein
VITAEVTANPADMLGPTVTCEPSGAATIAVEPVTNEHRTWLDARRWMVQFDEHVIVRRRDGNIAQIFPDRGDHAYLTLRAMARADLWCAEFVEVAQ